MRAFPPGLSAALATALLVSACGGDSSPMVDPGCGDGVLDSAESCDGAALGGATCVSLGRGAGDLACARDCSFDLSACSDSTPAECGNGATDPGEECDGADRAGRTCVSEGFSGGAIACTSACRVDTSACTGDGPECGDGDVEGAEVCEAENLAGQTCGTRGFAGGTLACAAGCLSFDTSGCYRCGDAVRNGTEACDVDDLGDATCANNGFDSGEIACTVGCTLDTSACVGGGPACDGTAAEGSEVCDGDDLRGATCESQGYDGGDLACASGCDAFDTTGCTTCGDDMAEGDEVCDSEDLRGATCEGRGFDGGDLGCAVGCGAFDTSACTTCGDDMAEGDEVCDGEDLRGATCATEAPTTPAGTLGCAVGCGGFDTSACIPPDPNDDDDDGVNNTSDPAPNDRTRCGDSDSDGCDDCSVEGTQTPANDGWDEDGDGQCELPLDYACMNGANAGSDPYRLESCIQFTLVNQDRALFTAESGGGSQLDWNEAIWEVAVAHARDMCRRGYFSHVNPEMQNAAARGIAALGYQLSENISVNFAPGASQYGFMNEPTCVGHRGNILRQGAIEVGIGYHDCDPSEAPDGYSWEDHHHIVQNFRNAGGQSSHCGMAANHCELPPTPPTVATCTPMLDSWGFCPDPEPSMLMDWGCPVD